MTTIAVVYDKGAAGPQEIFAGLRDLGELVFLTPDTAHTRAVRPLLAEFGTVVPIVEDPRLILEGLRTFSPDGIVTFSERMLPLTAHLASDLGLPGHSPEVVRLLTDKSAQRKRLAERHVDRTRSFPLDDPDQWREALTRVGLPAVIKPLRGEGSRSTHKVVSSNGLPDLVSELLDAERHAGVRRPVLVFEEFLEGRECAPYGDYVSVESLVSQGEISHCAVTGKTPLIRPFRETGQFWPACLPVAEQQAVLELAGAAIGALDLRTGIVHTEIKLTADGPRIIEVNGRLGGWISELCARTGHADLVAAAARLALGEDVRCDLFQSERTFFQYYNLAPAEGGRLDSVTGVRELRRVPGITKYRQLVSPGTVLPPGVTTHQLDVIIGCADRPEDMITAIDQALRVIQFQFSSDRPISGAELRDKAIRGGNHDFSHAIHQR
ncbi:ATP-grasp domain-containing protein [Actinocrispum wychmicini]|uniref:Biotin carboxylase n=1 Tax=Actinocrispum wychmicini TaxID=1213861 RepID=A0A4R2JRF4_9PSEU|nr:ATP-grasp domain-containing protein [Actinocrispum wychmicini]TCO62831.1 biotin carboxylase [Actinocrispum wychmicini]